MKKEFFAATVEQAVSQASEELGIPPESLSYTKLDQQFGESFQEKKVAIIVDCPAPRESGDTQAPSCGPTEEEETARAAGDVRWATYLIDGILDRMGIQSKTTSYQKEEHVILSVEFEQEPLDLRRGESREFRGAIQHVVNRSLTRVGEEGRRFIVDMGGTLEERSQKITHMAGELSDKINKMKKTVHIHLMDSQDRRLLHTAVMEGQALSSQGRGDKLFRVLSLEPKREK